MTRPVDTAVLAVDIRARRAELLRRMGEIPAVRAAWTDQPPQPELRLGTAIDDHHVVVGMPHAPALAPLCAQLRRAEWTLALTGAPWAQQRAHRRAVQTGRPMDDLYQEALIGTHRAAVRWDPTVGVSFLSYARWWVESSLTAAIDAAVGVVTLGLGVRQGRTVLQRAAASGERTEGWRVSQLLTVSQVDADALPLAAPSRSVEEQVAQAEEVAYLLRRLSARDRELIRQVYWQEQDYAAVAEHDGCSRQRIHQRHARIIETLRRAA